MPKTDFIPKTDSELYQWLELFNNRVQGSGASVGLSAEELAAIAEDTAKLREDIEGVHAAKIALTTAAARKRETYERVIKNLRRHCARIKVHPAYGETTGLSLGIVRQKSAWDATKASPKLRTGMNAGKVVLRYKKEQSHGVQIWCKRGAETLYSLLAIDTRSPFYDNRANLTEAPEERSYYAFFIDGNDEVVGQKSNVVVVNV